jgi:hypothetical protein
MSLRVLQRTALGGGDHGGLVSVHAAELGMKHLNELTLDGLLRPFGLYEHKKLHAADRTVASKSHSSSMPESCRGASRSCPKITALAEG